MRQSRSNAFQHSADTTASNFELIRAADALLANDLRLAEQLCRTFLQREPRNVGAIRLLAEVALRLGRLDDAEDLLAYCLELAPDFTLARHSFAVVLFRQLRYRDALIEIERLLAAEANRPTHLLLKAAILAQIGATEAAIEIYDALSKQYPGQAQLHLNRGHALKTVGKKAEALTAYRTAIGLQPELGEAYWSLSNLKTFQFDDADIVRMRAELERSVDASDDFVHLSFALGKALEDKREFDESYRHYSNGNAARRRTVHWDADAHHADIERIAAFFGREFLDSRRGAGNQSPAPIFIVGMPRAGSTLLEQILASHSEVEGTMELPDIMAIARQLAKRRGCESAYTEALATLAAADLEAIGKHYLERTAVLRSGASYFIDKMPNNFAYIGLIHLILPNAKVLDARRQPMACCFSVFKQLFANGQTWSYSLEEIGRYYRDYVDLMSHWDSVLPGRVLRVDYEAVVENAEEQVRRILDYCGLEFQESCLEFYRTERTIRTASSEQVRQPIYRTAVEQWRRYEAHLGPLKDSLSVSRA